MASRQQAEGEIQVYECACVAGGLHLTAGEYTPGLVVPHFKGYGDSVSEPRERKPSAGLLIGGVRREQTFESPSERRRGGRVSIGQADRERVEQHVRRPWRHGGGWPRPRSGPTAGAPPTTSMSLIMATPS